jgi:hypothetical protein
MAQTPLKKARAPLRAGPSLIQDGIGGSENRSPTGFGAALQLIGRGWVRVGCPTSSICSVAPWVVLR